MVKVKFTKEFLTDTLDLPYNHKIIKSDEIFEHGRWSVDHEIVFEHDGKYYMTTYSAPATESQWEEPWEYENEVDCVEVELREVTIQRWVPVD